MPRVLVLVLVLVVGLAGCSDDSGPDAASPTTGSTTGETSGSTSTSSTTATGDGGEGTESDAGSVPVKEEDPFCGAHQEYLQLTNDLPTDTLEQLQAKAAQLVDQIERVRELAPPDLESAVAVLASAITGYSDIVAAAGSLEALQANADALAPDPEAQAADETVNTWVGANCG